MSERGVVFRERASASELFHRLLAAARERYPEALAAAPFPAAARAFKSGYSEALTQFEAARVASPARAEIARFLVEESRALLLLRDDAGERPLAEAFAELPPAAALREIRLPGQARLAPSVRYQGQRFAAREFGALGRALCERSFATPAVAAALDWLAANALDAAGEIDLAGRRFAMLGAGAEIAPTQLLLAAGADVLWIDIAPPPEALTKDSTLSGRIFVPEGASDLLAQPREVAAAVARFADNAPVDLGLFAYAPGGGREWRIEAAMNAIADALGPERVRSLSLYVSPTHTPALSRDEVAAAEASERARPAWQRLLANAGALGRKARAASGGGSAVARMVVPTQGASYQAAQYVEKLLAMERWAAAPAFARVALSANVAAITRTRSLQHPIFAAAFVGAEAFGVTTLPAETTRALNGMLFLHDLLNPAAPGAAGTAREPARLFGQRVHGGLYVLPHALEQSLQVAALLGFARQPSLFGGFFRGGRR